MKIFTFKMFESKLDRIIYLLEKQLKELKMLNPTVQALVDEVIKTDGVEASALVAIQGYLKQITDLLAQVNMSDEDRALVDAKTAELTAATDALAAAIAIPAS